MSPLNVAQEIVVQPQVSENGAPKFKRPKETYDHVFASNPSQDFLPSAPNHIEHDIQSADATVNGTPAKCRHTETLTQ